MGNYIDLEFFESFMGTEYTTETEPSSTTINEYIDLSEQEINETTGRTWGVVSHTKELYDLPEQEVLLKSYPVISVTKVYSGDNEELTEGIDNDYIVDGEFIVFNKHKVLPNRCYVTYTSGYTGVRATVKWLTLFLTLQKLVQSTSSSGSNSKTIKVGPISISKTLGVQTVVNLDKDVDLYWKKLRRMIR